ncbi:hypothetical protein MMC07_004584 [Pseudocyphellaria aurata]|nr:hypothetical protein [Pseudocyphellaria aurata]
MILPACLAAVADTPEGLATPPTGAKLIDRTGWTVTADSFAPGHEPAKAVDDDLNSFWQSGAGAPLPHYLTIDMKKSYLINSLSYLPQQVLTSDGNIQAHTIQLSSDGKTWGQPVAIGTYRNDNSTKTTLFVSTNAQYVRLSATNGNFAIAANIKVYSTTFPAPAPGLGQWGPTIDFPLVPVAATVEHDSGKVLVWSSFSEFRFQKGPDGINKGGKTVTGTYDPSSKAVSERTVTNTGHDMFCPGISIDASGRVIVTGGNNAPKTSIFDPASGGWTAGPDMTIGRGYQSQATLSNGKTFTIGGSWAGGIGGKNGEIYDPAANKWSKLPDCLVEPLFTGDKEGVYKADNHPWVFGWKQGSIFHAGPSKQMNWYGTSGTGSQKSAGLRALDDHAMNGNAVMYDAVAGKILTLGGSPNYTGSQATSNVNIVTIDTPNSTPLVSTLGSMNYQRQFHNSVVLPDGKVFITGGQTKGASFTDYNSVLTPELFDPATSKFTLLAASVIPRNYHSVALLLPDGTVFSGGGGLCGDCVYNHFDGQIYTPQYLLNGARPVINSVSTASIAVGGTFSATTNTAVSQWSLIRYGSVTHTVNTDQRRIPLRPTVAGNTYTFKLPGDSGVVIPGYYMLFAVNSAGTPSVAKTVKVTI